ncbi:MAG: tRNA (uridine(34)/cytosine(34)/5-carboxymethylaminomethyluridine(34)-2'-O)-methyltransferase TrmL [Clostridia bacterium]|nr:tRNA (uridine(34)/cytosine(34)/5-carboxymethylaminomethyluridine(34)-2'-O)-methyltransferase TrmL [Clostridia bacterium]
MAVNIVLVEPEIPPNTGNIARTCAVTGAKLHLVEPLGFSIEDKHLKRAGLDYWSHLKLETHESIDAFLEKHRKAEMYFATTKGGTRYTDISYNDECFILFGKETAGLPQSVLELFPEHNIRIPMNDKVGARSLNLANSVNIILYEVLRQTGFIGLL